MKNKILSRQFIGSLIITVLLLFIYTQIASRILFTPIDFDEGYNLQISYHLSHDFLDYTTFTAKFDPNITTGPALLIPASLLIIDDSPLTPRIIMLLFTTIFIYLAQRYVYENRLQKIIFLILIIITPLFYFFSSHVLGELPGFVFFIISLIMISKKQYFLSGIFLSLSILTKQVYTLAILPVILQFLLIHIFSKKQRVTIFRNLALVLSGFLVVFFTWYLYIFSSESLSYAHFKRILRDNWQAWNILSQPKLSLIDKRLDMLGYIFNINGTLFSILIITTCVTVFKKLRHNYIAISLAFFSLFYTLYFLFLGSTNWYRHFLPSILAFIIILPLCVDVILEERNKKNILIMVLILVFTLLNSFYFKIYKSNSFTDEKIISQNLIFLNEKPLPLTSYTHLLNSQINTSKFVETLPKNANIAGISWWNAPEIEYLAGRKITRDPFVKDTDYIVTHYYGKLLGKTDYQYLNLIKNKKIIYNSEGYYIYEIY